MIDKASIIAEFEDPFKKDEHQQPKEYIRPEVMAFAEAMERILRLHDSKKGGWDTCTSHYLITRAGEELKELKDAMWPEGSGVCTVANNHGTLEINGHNYKAIMDECCDVANFVMMLYSNMKDELEFHNPTLKSIRSRPHPAPEQLCDDCNILELEEKVMNLEQQVKDERKRVLKRIELYIESKKMMSSGCDGHRFWIWSEPLSTLIESLRGGA